MKATISKVRSKYNILSDLINKESERYQNDRIGFHNPFYDPQRFEFLHIPKCAGTSVSEALMNLPGVGDHKHRPIAMRDFARITSGQPIETKYITVLRHPVERVWSYYNMIRTKGHFAWGKYTNSLDDFLTNCWEVNNMAIQYLVCKPRKQDIDFADLNVGKLVLSKFYFVTDVNHLNDDWKKLKLRLSKDFQIDLMSLPFLNKATQYELPTEEQVRKIEAHNQWDLRLYDSCFPRN